MGQPAAAGVAQHRSDPLRSPIIATGATIAATRSVMVRQIVYAAGGLTATRHRADACRDVPGIHLVIERIAASNMAVERTAARLRSLAAAHRQRYAVIAK